MYLVGTDTSDAAEVRDSFVAGGAGGFSHGGGVSDGRYRSGVVDSGRGVAERRKAVK